MSITIDLNDAVYSLSDALDLVGIDEVAHGKRVGYMAFKCYEHQGQNKHQRERIFHLGLLHDCGVSSSQVHQHLIDEIQWSHDRDHAITGARLLSRSAHLQHLATPILHHHTPWQELCSLAEVDDQSKFDANLIFLVDRVDALAAPHYTIDLQDQIDPIRDRIKSLSGSLFAPQAVDCFLKTSESDSFWLMLEPPHLQRFMVDIRHLSDKQPIENKDVKDIARIFAQIVDAKSSFTFKHSVGVASLSRYIASHMPFDQDTLDKIEIAGLLHDLGKLRIPDEILDKPGKLNRQDEQTMHRHSFETYQVLREINGFSDIALWAAYHHEKPNGNGYPFKREGEDLSLEARIIAVADVFQALAQDRPYRAALPIDNICQIINELADQQQLDKDLVAFVTAHAEDCHRHATNQVTD